MSARNQTHLRTITTATICILLLICGGLVGCGGDSAPSDSGAPDTPAADTPAADTPAADTPAADTPAADSPAGDTPAGDTPTGDTPSDTAGGDFACGDLTCTAGQYCSTFAPGQPPPDAGSGIEYTCQDAPTPCSPVTCVCLQNYGACDQQEGFECYEMDGNVHCSFNAP